ncbi:probable pre-mRNA-splicing factor ATP-dependent RNA helicase DEAH5, partial [Tanacetum coccineum]
MMTSELKDMISKFEARQCDNVEDFKRKLKQNNDNNDMHADLRRTLFTIIHACNNTLPPKHCSIVYANESQPSCSMGHDHMEGTEKALSFGERSKLRLLEQRQNLPIYKFKELVQAVHDYQVLLVIGETGVAARSTAKRVAKEFGCRLGEEVGYAISFEDCTRLETVINYMADGTLLMEILIDENLSQHSVIMLHKAHERSVSLWTIERRSDLCWIVTILGRTFSVEIYYTKHPEIDYFEAALITDPGFGKQNVYNPKLGLESIVITPISQAKSGPNHS